MKLGNLLLILSASSVNSQSDAEVAYFEALKEIDFDEVKADLTFLMTDSQDFFPADDGNYAGLMLRLAWHCSGTYRIFDGEGGCDGAHQRFEPERSWLDNVNLDKARLLLEPIKEKFGLGLSYGDLYTLAGNVAIESTGGRTLGFCAGRFDDIEGNENLILGPGDLQEVVSPCEEDDDGECEAPLGTTNLELIYVDPAGFLGQADPADTVDPIRDAFSRMGMNDQETVILIGGGHAIGRMHGPCPDGPGPTPFEQPEDPWPGLCDDDDDDEVGIGANTFTSGFHGAWTLNPSQFDNSFFSALSLLEFEEDESPADLPQFRPVDDDANEAFQDIRMLTTDMALLEDDAFEPHIQLYTIDANAFFDDFAVAWYKLTSRDMGPASRCFGDDVPPDQPFQGENLTLSEEELELIEDIDFEELFEDMKDLFDDNDFDDIALISEMAYLCASTYRATDHFGGCNGARILLEPERDFEDRIGMADLAEDIANELDIEDIDGLSISDMIVLIGNAAIEESANNGEILLDFCPGRKDAVNGSQNLEIFQFDDKLVQLTREARILGLGVEGFVCLMGRPRSEDYMEDLGYSGTYPDAENLDNEYFKLLLRENFTIDEDVEGVFGPEFVDETGDIFITERDFVLTLDPTLRAAVSLYAGDNDLFLSDFAKYWTLLMNADRFDGPINNLCTNVSVFNIVELEEDDDDDDDDDDDEANDDDNGGGDDGGGSNFFLGLLFGIGGTVGGIYFYMQKTGKTIIERSGSLSSPESPEAMAVKAGASRTGAPSPLPPSVRVSTPPETPPRPASTAPKAAESVASQSDSDGNEP